MFEPPDSMGRYNRRAGGRAQPGVRVAAESRVLPTLAQLLLHRAGRAARAALRTAAGLRVRLPRLRGMRTVSIHFNSTYV